MCAIVPMQSVHIINNVLSLNPAHTTLCDKYCQGLVAGRWFSQSTPVSSTNKTDRHDIIEILLKVAGVKHQNPYTPTIYGTCTS